MSENDVTPEGDTIDPHADGSGQEPGTGTRTFTESELQAIVRDRLARQKRQFADYEELKTAKQKLDELETAQMTELEKVKAQVEKLQVERDAAQQLAQDRLIRSAFVAEAARAGAAHPEDAFALADLSGVAIDDAGQVSGVSAAVTALVEANRLVLASQPGAPRLDGGAGSGERPTLKTRLSAEEVEIARKMGMSPEDYAASKAAMEAKSNAST